MPIPSEPQTVGFTHGYLLSPLPGIDPLCGKLWVSLTRMPCRGTSPAARKGNDAFPEAVEAEEEFDFLATDGLADGLHGALPPGALERVAAPNLEREMTVLLVAFQVIA